MIYVYPLEPNDDVMDFTIDIFMEYMAEDKVWSYKKLSAYDLYGSELLDFGGHRRREFMVYNSDTGTLKYMWIEFGIRTLKERDITKVSEEKVEI